MAGFSRQKQVAAATLPFSSFLFITLNTQGEISKESWGGGWEQHVAGAGELRNYLPQQSRPDRTSLTAAPPFSSSPTPLVLLSPAPFPLREPAFPVN